jgi:hypothetical protein
VQECCTGVCHPFFAHVGPIYNQDIITSSCVYSAKRETFLLREIVLINTNVLNKVYLTIIKVLGVIALSMLAVAGILYIGGNQTNAAIALGICLSVSGVALMRYSLR